MKKLFILFLAVFLVACQQGSSNSDFIIKNHTLVEYIGNEKEIVIPDDVTKIGASAFETSDEYPKDEIEKITVPGTVKVIDAEAFAFCYADIIIIEEGCEEIGDRAFMDSYPDEVTLPASLTKIGRQLFETEEGLSGTKFHIVKGSSIDLAIQKQNPYGSYEIVYD
ncbi:MAG: leucine-rich repeat protein [Erysipelotrichaceae bacterium]|nr:leucine-rich repeat protein [Erysipelotrichaceae bacterium]